MHHLAAGNGEVVWLVVRADGEQTVESKRPDFHLILGIG